MADLSGRTRMSVDGQPYVVALDKELLRGGKQALVRETRPSEPTDPGRLGQVFWHLANPLGNSREGLEGQKSQTGAELQTDYARNVDLRWNELLTGPPERNYVTVPQDGVYPMLLGRTKLGTAKLGAVTSATAGNVSGIQDDRGYIFFQRGELDTQVDPATMDVIASVSQPGTITQGAVWLGTGYLCLGDVAPVQRRRAVSAAGASYENVESTSPAAAVYAQGIQPSAGIAAFITTTPGAATKNYINFTTDDFSALANPFPVSDAGIQATGIGLLGPYFFYGTANGVFATTESGQPVALLKFLRASNNAANAVHMVEAWGWLYVGTVKGVFAVKADGSYSLVSLERERAFEGPIRGTVTAMCLTSRDELLVALKNEQGDTDVIRGLFHARGAPLTWDVPKWTPYSGVPDWFPFYYFPQTHVGAINETGLRTNPTVVVGEGPNVSYFTCSDLGYEIADPAYRFGTDPGDWYGTTMMQKPGLRKYPQFWRCQVENADANNYFNFSVLRDDDIGGQGWEQLAVLNASGFQIIRTLSAGAPISTQWFRRVKPWLHRVASSNTVPVQIRGPLELVYVERPDAVDQLNVTLVLGQLGPTAAADYARLQALAGSRSEPIKIVHPRYGTLWGFLESAQPEEVSTPGVLAAKCQFVLWDVS